jgi:methionyl aminopeptidase
MSIISDQEALKKLRHSGQILASCQHHLAKMIQPGLSAGEIEKFALRFAAKHGARLATLGYKGYKYGTCVSINQEVVHGLPLESKIIPENVLVSLDIMLDYQGLITDCSRTWIVGEVGQQAKKLVEKTRQAMWNAISKAKPGNRVGDLEWAMQSVAEENNFGNVTALGGHGVGLEIHDEPMILTAGKPGKGPKLFENMVFTVEPMFTLGGSEVLFDQTKDDGWTVRTKDDSWSAHEEHTVLITKKGCEVLTEVNQKAILD